MRRLHADVIGVVFVGGSAGGYARYAVTEAWSTSHYGFPWSTLAVNLAGAFVLALVIVVTTGLRPTKYLRPLLGTGFCGALTTFSSVVVATSQLVAHHHPLTGAAYAAASTVGGLAAVVLGMVVALSVGARATSGRADRR